MYCVIRASAPCLYNVYQRYDIPITAIFSYFYDHCWVKNDIGTYDPIGTILLHSFLLITSPSYPSSFHEIIFILVTLIFLR